MLPRNGSPQEAGKLQLKDGKSRLRLLEDHSGQAGGAKPVLPRLTAYIREHDATSFSSFMAFRDSTVEDYVLMAFVLHIMLTRHQEMLAQLMPMAAKEASV
ncbi:hypothetical protein DXT99_07520 [Pontibacter diazotrophicus]|uniref:Uncharacterized protein n=1 Tax=Pontibacter diazotrophicus TaxID=1400979 RepID=A0A3D8LEF1_9BACT|nr:hypothetical protein [Pontibacter diazotrophicus]RDV15839.1 hypothetical protein DXT99_07520 [Pontibacter diazotrophicus]